ncbi:MAG: hypothetical protein A2539_06305 [Elusimicrobia bacterium RIFOXYD2_FULL_34_15]|nr:MAG: hypothetical protein A2539_06305 [Elusimicrobia bacterium RIFOXYD2_FULL_34_15]
MIKDITKIFKNTESNIIKNLISSGSIVLGIKVEGKAGLLVKDIKLSDELQKKISKSAKIAGFISTDELPHYGITSKEKSAIEKEFSCKKNDTVVFIAAEKSKAEKAVDIIDAEMKGKKAVTKKSVKTKKKTTKTKKSKVKKAKKAR